MTDGLLCPHQARTAGQIPVGILPCDGAAGFGAGRDAGRAASLFTAPPRAGVGGRRAALDAFRGVVFSAEALAGGVVLPVGSSVFVSGTGSGAGAAAAGSILAAGSAFSGSGGGSLGPSRETITNPVSAAPITATAPTTRRLRSVLERAMRATSSSLSVTMAAGV